MKKKQKPILSARRELNNKIIFKTSIIIIALIIIIIAIMFILNNYNAKNQLVGEARYYTGKLFTANQAANMLDTINNNENIVISPLNINSSLALLYNGSDNNTNKELKKYFNNSSSKINSIMLSKLSSFKNENKKSNDFTELYEEYIKDLEAKKYHNLNSSTIRLLSNSEKKELQELLEKINLVYNRLNNKNNVTLKYIKNYSLTDEVITNEYTLETLLNETLDNYETYSINNKIINYHELYFDDSLEEKDINEDYLTILKDYNTNITFLDLKNIEESVTYINEKIQKITDNHLNRIVEKSDFPSDNIMINSLYFNYEWDKIISSNNVRNEEFYELDGNINQVEMMYSKETRYLENNNARGFIKDFQDKKYSYVGILPKKEGDFSLSSLNLDSLLTQEKEENITIGLPKYSLRTEVSLNKLIEEQNIKELFSKNANYSKITDKDLYLSESIQKIYLEIGEKGTVSSSIQLNNLDSYTEEEDEKKIVFNRPFCFLIINNETNDIILAGKIVTFNN